MMLLQDLPTLLPEVARAERTRRRCRAMLDKRRPRYAGWRIVVLAWYSARTAWRLVTVR